MTDTIFDNIGLSKIIEKNTILKNGESFFKYSDSAPNKLFKYYGNLEFAHDAIMNKRIHIESPLTYNDPYDSACILKADDLYYIDGSIRHMRIIMYIALGQDKQTLINEYFKEDVDRENYSFGDFIDFVCERDASLQREKIANQIISMMQNSGIYSASGIGVSCFSERNDSLLMWAYCKYR